METTQELMQEHAAVLVALEILDKVATAVAQKNEKAPEHLGQLLDFFKGFVDRCHHGKEEDVLFPELVRRGLPREGGPIAVMLSEHEVGRSHVRAMADGLGRLRGGEAAAAAVIRDHADAYRDMLQAHIHKENNILFPMADRILPADVDRSLKEQFDVIERDRIGAGKHEAYHAMLHNLKAVYEIA
jgi:hemerythrin-like domain-containing protein